MAIEMIILILIVVAGFIFIYFSNRQNKVVENKDDQNTGFQLLMQQVSELQKTVDHKLSESEKTLRESLQFQSGQSNKIIADITERLARLDETNKKVVDFTSEIVQLQDILKNPKQRGILGEYYLETLLKNVLPPNSFEMQYTFPDGNIVDAAVFVKDKIIPIDSKFSLENYNRLSEAKDQETKDKLEKRFVNDLKERITETSKYIQPENGTMEFAFMFIPHEAIYYDLLVNKVGAIQDDTENLIQRAASKYKVIIVSPTSFLAYLQTVLQGLKAMQIEESAKEIRKRVSELGKHLKAHEEYHNKLGNSIKTVVNQYNASSKEIKKIDKDVMRITDEKSDLDPVLIGDIEVEKISE